MKGLVLGKFYPLHLGHTGLIRFARAQCKQLVVLICASDKETIPGHTRLKWVRESFKDDEQITPVLLNYAEHDLPNTSVASKAVSKIWAEKINSIITGIDIVFSSETYGEYLAEFLGSRHIPYDPVRVTHHISSTMIREKPFEYWNFLAAAAKPCFVKKICLYGTESTGKSTLTERLAAYFKTGFVPEKARLIMEHTEQCTEEHLQQIIKLQAATINEKLATANKLLFVDTDLNITRSYSRYLFGKKLPVEPWIEDANRFHLYLYLEKDAPHIQDGTRLNQHQRNELDISHKRELLERGIGFIPINGSWEERFRQAINIIQQLWPAVIPEK